MKARARVSFFLRGNLSEHHRARNFMTAFRRRHHEIQLFHLGGPAGVEGFDYFQLPNDTFARRPSLKNLLARLRFVCAGLGLAGGYSGRLYSRPIIRVIHKSSARDGRMAVAFVSDIFYLPAVVQAAVFDLVILDAREFYPEQMGSSWAFRLLRRPEVIRLCRRYLAQTGIVLTVSDGLSQLYKERFGLSPVVVRSALPTHGKVMGSPQQKTSGFLRLVYMGVANRNRGLDELVEALVESKTNHRMYFYLTGKPNDIQYLQRKFAGEPRVVFMPAVSPDLIVSTMARYDLGLSYFPPKTENLRFGLGNKFFQYLGAGLPVIVGPTPEMEAIVLLHDCGFVVPSFNKAVLAEFFRGLSISNVKEKLPGVASANSALSFENEVLKLMELVDAG